MGTTEAPKGPDLRDGVDLASLPEGKPFAGVFDGEAVVLVRRGEDVRAIGGSCTHYGGPLAEGLVVGDTVRCPWHHACFDLTTGDARGAPALSPVACFRVERDGGRVRLTGKQEPPAPAPIATPRSVLVIGAGAAAAACADRLRRDGHAGSITLVGAEPPGPVDRPNLSKDYLAGTAPEEWIPLGTAGDWSARNVELVIGDPVVALDAAKHEARLSSGRVLAGDAILIATGAEPVRLPIEGADRPFVHVLRTLADSRSIAAHATKGGRAVVIGAGFIGLEAAASLRARGMEVDVVAPDAVPLERIVGPELGRFVQSVHEDHGVRFHLGHKPAAFVEDGVRLDDGRVLPASVAVTGVGVRPRVELAKAAGLTVDNGIVCDAELRTSAPGIWAAGDVAKVPDPRLGEAVRIEHWVVAERQGQAVARAMLGRPTPWTDVPFFWSQHHDATISVVGHLPRWDRLVVRGDLKKRDAFAAYYRADRPLMIATIGRDTLALEAEALLEKNDVAALSVLLDRS